MKKILVVEDNPGALAFIRECLEEEGYEFLGATSGAGMWALAEKNTVDLFILDLNLPDENGLDLTREIRQKSDVGIIIVSGKSAEIDRVVGIEVGADDYLTKPFSPHELLARVRRVLWRTKGKDYQSGLPMAGSSGQVYRFEDWELDVSARRLSHSDGRDVELTSTEFELLQVLVERPNQVFSREQLLNHTHGSQWTGDDRKIDGLVSQLRRKLQSPGEGPSFIKTIRNAGYIFTSQVRKKSDG